MVGVFRKMLLDVLTDNPGSIEVENTYLKAYRQRLKSLVQQHSTPGDAISAVKSQRSRKAE